MFGKGTTKIKRWRFFLRQCRTGSTSGDSLNQSIRKLCWCRLSTISANRSLIYRVISKLADHQRDRDRRPGYSVVFFILATFPGKLVATNTALALGLLYAMLTPLTLPIHKERELAVNAYEAMIRSRKQCCLHYTETSSTLMSSVSVHLDHVAWFKMNEWINK